jgi:hypothetical protein
VDVDKVLMPPKDSLKDLGFNSLTVPTKITVKEDIWGNILVDLVPTLLGFVVIMALFMFLIGKMGG